MELCDEVSCDKTGHRPVGSDGLNRVWEINTSLLDGQTGDRPPRDLGCVPLKEGREERLLQHILHRLEHNLYVRGDAPQKIPLLLEGLLQSHIGGQWVLVRYPSHDFHQIFPPLYLIL